MDLTSLTGSDEFLHVPQSKSEGLPACRLRCEAGSFHPTQGQFDIRGSSTLGARGREGIPIQPSSYFTPFLCLFYYSYTYSRQWVVSTHRPVTPPQQKVTHTPTESFDSTVVKRSSRIRSFSFPSLSFSWSSDTFLGVKSEREVDY
jgi:hypothetical protein